MTHSISIIPEKEKSKPLGLAKAKKTNNKIKRESNAKNDALHKLTEEENIYAMVINDDITKGNESDVKNIKQEDKKKKMKGSIIVLM